MGCSGAKEKLEDKMMLIKLKRMEIQMEKEKELKKLSEMEGRPITSLDQYNGFDTRTEKRRIKTNPNDRYFETYTSKKSKRTKKSGSSPKKKKKDKDTKSKKKKRAISEGASKKKKKKK